MLPVGVDCAGELFPNAAGGRGAGEELSMEAIEEFRGGGVDAAGGGCRVAFCVYAKSKKLTQTIYLHEAMPIVENKHNVIAYFLRRITQFVPIVMIRLKQ